MTAKSTKSGFSISSILHTKGGREVSVNTDGQGYIILSVPGPGPVILTEDEATGLSAVFERAAADA